MVEFIPQDLRHIVTPHYDSLVVMMQLGAYQIQKILTDTRSSTNIFFWGCFRRMEQEHKKLKPMQTILIEFNGKTTYAVGQLILDVVVETVRVCTLFLVETSLLPYNAFLG